MGDLNGKVALVTGGSRGIGAGIARRLAADGADVAITYEHDEIAAKSVVDVLAAAGRRGLAIQADGTDPEAVRAAVRRTARELGRLDILVNNAGIFRTGAVEDVPDAEFAQVLALHVQAPFVAAQAALPMLGGGGRIISIGSNMAHHVTGPGTVLYAASKSALDGFTRALAREVGPRGITVNVVHPGPVDTDMNPADGAHADAQRANAALGRYAEPTDIAAAVAYLAGPGGRNVTGTGLVVDSGVNA